MCLISGKHNGQWGPGLDLLRQDGRVVSTDYAWGSKGCVQIWESKRSGWAGQGQAKRSTGQGKGWGSEVMGRGPKLPTGPGYASSLLRSVACLYVDGLVQAQLWPVPNLT